ncbi:MAG: hypothetical protein MMC33_003742 [Icmadophila ericetorum]|nr:hypothetical protein [Icmadophila ericetorum]
MAPSASSEAPHRFLRSYNISAVLSRSYEVPEEKYKGPEEMATTQWIVYRHDNPDLAGLHNTQLPSPTFKPPNPSGIRNMDKTSNASSVAGEYQLQRTHRHLSE